MAHIPEIEPTVYIVDDDEAVRSALLFLFSSAGMTARAFSSAEEFLAEGQIDDTGCLVLDIHVPGMNGLELIEAIRRMTSLPVICVTADSGKNLKAQALQAGAIAFVRKPLVGEKLLNLVRDSIRQSLERDMLKVRSA